ncbi:UBX domain-containing protein 11 [Aplysia californica]|uniref:UBX domain-containing protein 11 n=1 Tax=Aplysia californica TaxID=6500 RepID=A0ABM0K412_APLCA|nr:UBX domain-containing protein 11 [Aplysia californica]
MSSPFHSLKKNKVPLFPGHMTGNRPIPFRHPEYSEDESRLLAEITTSMIQEKRKKSPFNGMAPLGPGQIPGSDGKLPGEASGGEDDSEASPPPNDQELMRLMMNRIAQLEQKSVTQEQEIRNKDRQIKVLEDKLRIAEKARRESGNGNSSGIRDLETHCLLLQQQVHEMETFLAEYGMVWVGDQSNDNSDVYVNDGLDDDEEGDDEENNNLTETSVRTGGSPDNSIASSDPFGLWRQDTSLPEASSHFNIDFNLLMENIKDLNVMAGAGLAQIKKTSDGARFEVPESVQLTIYANGMLMFDGPFRPYTEPTTRQCIRDILDGYFPSELQSRYPDGVPFVVTDLRNTYFQPKVSLLAFTGEGQTLGGETKPSRLIPSNYSDPTRKMAMPQPGVDKVCTTSQLPGKPLTPAQFLNKLPKSVIKDGKVIDVRDSVGRVLAGGDDSSSKPNVSLVSTTVTKEMSDSVLASTDFTTPLERPKSYRGHSEVTTLRVVTETGNHTYIVKMKFTETVGDLRSYLDTQRRPTTPYDIVSTFPHKVHSNNTMTLEASGLTPNAVLHLRPCKK